MCLLVTPTVWNHERIFHFISFLPYLHVQLRSCGYQYLCNDCSAGTTLQCTEIGRLLPFVAQSCLFAPETFVLSLIAVGSEQRPKIHKAGICRVCDLDILCTPTIRWGLNGLWATLNLFRFLLKTVDLLRGHIN